jgi:hypothetical protein
MALPPPRNTWLRAPGRLALACWLVLAWMRPASAEEPHYTNEPSFIIPFISDPNEVRIHSVVLFWSEDAGINVHQFAEAGPKDKSFRFTAPRDGCYWFWVQTKFQDGKLLPQQINRQQPGLRVYVDTQAPQLYLKPIQPRDGTVAVEWDIREDNPNWQTFRMIYRAVNSEQWLPLRVQPERLGQHSWSPEVPSPTGQYEVRLHLIDKAKNGSDGKNEARTIVSPGAVAPSQPNSQGARVNMVNKRRIQLNYKLESGKSGVEVVEVWRTQDTRNWQKCGTPEKPIGSDETKSVVVDVPSEGRWGFVLIAKSGVGLSEPAPTAGTQPQVWIEVDETKPAVHIGDISVLRGADSDRLSIRWTATDKFMADTPITISYSEEQDGTWHPIASNIRNDGVYVWDMPKNLSFFEFFVRVAAVDQAGNVGVDTTAKKVKVDTVVPKTQVIKVEPANTAPGTSGTPPSMP